MKKLYLYVLLVSVLVMLGGCNHDDGDGNVNNCNSDCFPNGVAAGDVDQTSVILWARARSAGWVTFEYGEDPNFSGPPDGVKSFDVKNPDVPAKVEITGLRPGTPYHYRVCIGQSCPYSDPPGPQEARGTFRTPYDVKDGRKGLSFGVSSCWRGDLRPFVSMKNVEEQDLDFFVALGDTVYADSAKTGNGTPTADEIDDRARTLSEFRFKHELAYARKNASDESFFAKARASTAFYVNIDDHEIVNNFQGGATPLSQYLTVECQLWGVCFCDPISDFNPYNDELRPFEGDIKDCERDYINETYLFRAGLLAWLEYNPVREEKYTAIYDNNGNVIFDDPRTTNKYKLYRYRTFGKDAALFMLDTRSFRDAPVAILNDLIPVTAYAQNRTMLGVQQLKDLQDDLVDAQARGIQWKFVLVPEPIQNMGKGGAPDRFEGYAYERALILDHIRENCITNVVFISGDIHGTLANNLVYKKDFVDRKIYSSTWDISTGPVAHPEPIGPAVLSILDPLTPFYDVPTYWKKTNRDGKNDYFEEYINKALYRNRSPYIGLDDENTYNLFLDQQNASMPVVPGSLQGRYSSTNTNGWTEFEIDAGTSILKVTTWGIERDENEQLVGPTPGPGTKDSPIIVSQFEVKPRSKSDISCGVGKPNGSFCGRDNVCASGRCSLLVCMAKLRVGASCRRDSDCRSGDCSNEILPRNRACR